MLNRFFGNKPSDSQPQIPKRNNAATTGNMMPPSSSSSTCSDNTIPPTNIQAFELSSSKTVSVSFNQTQEMNTESGTLENSDTILCNENNNRLILLRNLKDITIGSRFLFEDVKSKRQFAIFRTSDNRIYAIDQFCYHMGGPLDRGDIEDLKVYYTSQQRESYSKKHSCVVCPWHHYYISLQSGESFYLDMDRHYKSKGQRQRTYPLVYESTSLDIYLELDHRLELSTELQGCDQQGCSEKPLPPIDSDHYVKIHQQKNQQSDSKPHSVVNLKELKERREQKKQTL